MLRGATVEKTTAWAERHRPLTIALSGGMALVIAFVDWRIQPNLSLGLLYVFPLLLASLVLARTRILLMAAICALLREAFSPFHWQPDYEIRILLTFGAFASFGLLISELNRNRRLAIANLRQREEQVLQKRKAEEQVQILVEACPLSILIADGGGMLLLANSASRELLGLAGDLSGENLFTYLPSLGPLPQAVADGDAFARLEVESPGSKRSGEGFFARVWITAYRTGARLHPGSTTGDLRMAVVLWDSSEDVLGRETAHSESLRTTARVLLAALSHEMKNLASAAGMLVGRISSRPDMQHDPDIQALANVTRDLSEFASAGLRFGACNPDAVVDLSSLMEQVRVTLQPLIEEAGVRTAWHFQDRLPLVRCDHSTLMQVFLNLTINSERALRGLANREIAVRVTREPNAAVIRFCDSGPGVREPERIFEVFHSGTGDTGLGLYISRALLRSYGGDLSYEPGTGGVCFVVRLLEAPLT